MMTKEWGTEGQLTPEIGLERKGRPPLGENEIVHPPPLELVEGGTHSICIPTEDRDGPRVECPSYDWNPGLDDPSLLSPHRAWLWPEEGEVIETAIGNDHFR